MLPDNEAPAEIFAWLETTKFDLLSRGQKEKVLLFFSLEEYDAMYLAMQAVDQAGAVDRKAALFEHFDRHHRSTEPAKVFQAGWIWKAAAVLLPLAMMVIFFILRNGNELNTEQHVLLADTVYVRTEVPGATEVIHDTVYITRMAAATRPQERVAQENLHPGPSEAAEEEMQGLSFNQLQSISNEIKRNSLLHDTLWRSFEPVAL